MRIYRRRVSRCMSASMWQRESKMSPKFLLSLPLLLLLSLPGEGMQCLNGFVDSDTLTEKAAFIGKIKKRERQQRIIPNIKFTCSGTLQGWMFVAESKDGTEYPELQIWRPTNAQSTQYTKIHGTSEAPVSTQHSNVYQHSGISVHFREGDILGVFQPEGRRSRYSLSYQENGGPVNYRLDMQNSPLATFEITGNDVKLDQSYPIVGLQTSNPECVSGFLSMTSLIAKGRVLARETSTVVARDEEQRIIPAISFGCSGTVDKWIVAAEDRGTGGRRTEYPELQIWRPSGSISHMKVQSSTMQLSYGQAVGLNVYEYTLDPPIQFQPEDILGLYQPDDGQSAFTIYYQGGGGPLNYRLENQNGPSSFLLTTQMRSDQNDLPLVTVTITADCGDLRNPRNGRVSARSTTAGSVATYRCNAGYVLVGEQERFCQVSNGQWSSSAPTCNPVDCGALAAIPNGRIATADGETTLGSVATYSCEDGFDLIGSSTRTCQESQRWSGEAPTCQGIVCGSPQSPQNGEVTVSQSEPQTEFGSTATYTCNAGYRLVGEVTRTCQENGRWSRRAPECELIDCGSLSDPSDGHVSIIPGPDGINVDAIATYSCDAGYRLVGPRNRTCLESGRWSRLQPVCRRINCDPLENPPNGRVVITTAGVMTAVYSCNEGYVLVGRAQQICRRRGGSNQWSGNQPECEIIDCSDSPSLLNGSVSTNGSTLHSVARYTCNEGFNLRGSNTLVCQYDGLWSEHSPTCEVVDCGMPLQLENGSIAVAGTTLGSLANFTCDRGYRLTGEQVHTCLADGNWSGEVPRCKTAPPPTHTLGPVLKTTSPILTSSSVQHMPVPTLPLGSATLDPTSPTGASPRFLSTPIIIVLSILLVIVLVMSTVAVVLCVRRKYRKLAMQQNTFENPVYAASADQSFSDQPQNCNLTSRKEERAYEFRELQHTDLKQEDPHYDAANFLNLAHIDTSRESPHYEMAPSGGIQHSYEFPDVVCLPYYEIAGASQYEIPVSPYEIPTPQAKPRYVFGTTLHWGIYVPTEEQRRLSAADGIQALQKLCGPADQRAFFEESESYWKPASDSISLYEQLARNKYREILRRQVQITEHLGSGQFGTVHKGLWQSPGGTVEVAVKTLKPGSNENDRIKFLQEAAINGQFQHPNIVQLHGVVTVGEPVMIVLELLANGDLRNYLVTRRPAPGEMVPPDWPQLLLRFSKDIASGVEYLAGKSFVHRDLAARNILIAEDRTCKISDFGMSRDLEDENYYVSHGGKIPVKWTAPEALHFKKYSTASDVWGFGTVMYEIWSLGHKPFEGYTNTQAIKMIDRGFRLSPPPGCPRALYEVMIQCWHLQTAYRPTFSELLQSLSQPEAELLDWSEEDMGVHPQAAVLGAPLEAGKDLYPELQITYQQ